MINVYKIIAGIYLVVVTTSSVVAQNFDKATKKDVLKVAGGINYSSVFYDAKGIDKRRQTYTWFVNGKINVSVADFNLPFTFNYSNNQIRYTQPYNIQSFNPTYKWIKGYAGITSMNFSQYTLANHIFSGAGIELSPKKWKFAAMYGQLKKAVEFDPISDNFDYMSYKRMGVGTTIGYEKKGHGFKFIYFSAKDDPSSLLFIPLNSPVTPMQNTVISAEVKTKLFKKVILQSEYALSGLTTNINLPKDFELSTKNKLPGIFSPNSSSRFFSAFKSSVGYSVKQFNLIWMYERVAPGYSTLGAYYFNNDLENITLSPSFSALKGKLNISFNSGLQRNNLNNEKLNTTTRWVGAFNLSFMPNTKWNLNASYNNFSTYTKQRPLNDPFFKNTLDTLNFYQLTQSAMFSVSRQFGKTKTKQNIFFNANYQVVGQNQGSFQNPGLFGANANLSLPSYIINGNLTHAISIIKTKTAFSYGLNSNYNYFPGFPTLYFGPNLNLSRTFYNNTLRCMFGHSYNEVFVKGEKTNSVLNHRFTLSYSPKTSKPKTGKMNISLSVVYLQKLKSVETAQAFNEFTGNFAIGYGF